MGTRPTRTSEAGIAIIKHFETLHDGNLKVIGLQPKACPTGWWTVGYGRVVIDPKTKARLNTKDPAHARRALELFPALTEEQAVAMLQEDLRAREQIVLKRITAPLSQQQFDALVSLEYNTGAIGARTTIVRVLNEKRYDSAALEFLKWTKGRVNGELRSLPGLVRRRKSEHHLWTTGEVRFFNTKKP